MTLEEQINELENSVISLESDKPKYLNLITTEAEARKVKDLDLNLRITNIMQEFVTVSQAINEMVIQAVAENQEAIVEELNGKMTRLARIVTSVALNVKELTDTSRALVQYTLDNAHALKFLAIEKKSELEGEAVANLEVGSKILVVEDGLLYEKLSPVDFMLLREERMSEIETYGAIRIVKQKFIPIEQIYAVLRDLGVDYE